MTVVALYDNITGAETSNTIAPTGGADVAITSECRNGAQVDVLITMAGGLPVKMLSLSGNSYHFLGWFSTGDLTISAKRTDSLAAGKARVLATYVV